MTSTSHKTRKSEAIAACLTILAKHFGTTPKDVLRDSKCKRGPVRDTRQLLAYHLHECGMSYAAIGKIWTASERWTYEAARHAALFLVHKNKHLLSTLPKVETTLSITQAISCARFENPKS